MEAAGSEIAKVVKVNVFITDMANFAGWLPGLSLVYTIIEPAPHPVSARNLKDVRYLRQTVLLWR